MNNSLDKPFRIAVLISGGGTTLHNLIEKIGDGQLSVEIGLVISSDSDAQGLEFARDAKIATHIARRLDSIDAEGYSHAVFDPCREAAVDLVVMGGFLIHVLIPSDFENRVVNIHPGLIPAFCGKGFYGMHVHEAVLEYGVKLSGCTIHFVDNQYDHGPVILQRAVDVLDNDTPDDLASRIFEAECDLYPEAIGKIASGTVRVVGRKVIGG